MSATTATELSSSSEAAISAISTFASTTGISQEIQPAKKTYRVVLSTTDSLNTATDVTEDVVEARRLYPHVFDATTNMGEAVTFIQVAIDDSRQAIDDFMDANLQSVGTRLSQIATLLKKAYSISHTNDPFAAVVSFLRRAVLVVAPEDVSLPQLNSLLSALKGLIENPLLTLDDATDLIDNLTNGGWSGEHETVEKIVALFLNEQDAESLKSMEVVKEFLAKDGAI